MSCNPIARRNTYTSNCKIHGIKFNCISYHMATLQPLSHWRQMRNSYLVGIGVDGQIWFRRRTHCHLVVRMTLGYSLLLIDRLVNYQDTKKYSIIVWHTNVLCILLNRSSNNPYRGGMPQQISKRQFKSAKYNEMSTSHELKWKPLPSCCLLMSDGNDQCANNYQTYRNNSIISFSLSYQWYSYNFTILLEWWKYVKGF